MDISRGWEVVYLDRHMWDTDVTTTRSVIVGWMDIAVEVSTGTFYLHSTGTRHFLLVKLYTR